eukprot:scaffold484_cov177-Ochromonas_danica.AAC.1
MYLTNVRSDGSQSPKKVAFTLPVAVYHWSKASKHPIDIFEGISLAQFLLRVRSAFAEELAEKAQDSLNIKQYRVTTDEELLQALLPFNDIHGRWPELYIFDEADEKRMTTPIHSPFAKQAADEEDDDDSLSVSSRDSVTSRLAKLRDNSQCVIYGLKGFANLEACHVYEIKEFDGLASSLSKELSKKLRKERLKELKQEILDGLGLNTINDVTNLDTMCRACHESYDCQDISISPSRYVIISHEIRDKVANPDDPK